MASSKSRVAPFEHKIYNSMASVNQLAPHEISRHFYHAVHEGNVELVKPILKHQPLLLNEVDKSLYGAVHYAVKAGHIQMLLYLLQQGANVNLRGREGTRPLHVAVTLRNNVEPLRELLKVRKVKVDAIDNRGQTPLHLACKRNNPAAVELLLEHKANVKLRATDGSTVLHLPARKSHLELCQLLTWDTHLVNSTDKHGITPVMTVCEEGSMDLLEHFFNVISQSASGSSLTEVVNAGDIEGNTAMHYAARSNRHLMIEQLHLRKAELNRKNSDGQTPLHLAATLGHIEAALKLLDLGASISSVDAKARMPLHSAIIAKQEAMAEMLLDRNADASAVDEEFMTPFAWACRRGLEKLAGILLNSDPNSLKLADIEMRNGLHWAILIGSQPIVQLMLSKQESLEILDASDEGDRSPLHYAAAQNHIQLFQLLVQAGADLHKPDANGRTPTQAAVKLGFTNILETVVGMGGEYKRVAVRHRDSNGLSSLLIAAEEGHLEIFEFLIQQAADFTVRDDNGRTALMLAVSNGHHAIASTLVDRGVDVNAFDANKNTPLHYACKCRRSTDCLQLLLDSGASLQENYNGETAIDVAVLSSNEQALELLFSEQFANWSINYRRANGRTHLDILIEHSPQIVTKLLNRSTTESGSDNLDKNFMVAYDFSNLDPGPDDPASSSERYLALRTMVEHRREDLLSHPLSRALLVHKWTIVRYFFLCDFFFYSVFLGSITAFIVDNGPLPPTLIDETTGCKNTSSSGTYTGTQQKLTSPNLIVQKYVVILLLFIRLFIELIKLIFKKLHYLQNYENYFFLVMYAFSFAFMWPPDSEPCRYNWICGVFAIIFAWALLIFQFEHLPIAGIYSIMFQKVVVSLVKVLLIFLFFIVGFGLAFQIGFVSETPFALTTYSILKTFDMTVGNLDFVTYFVSSIGGNMQTAMFVVFVLFVVLMPIALMNLLVGIAVGDIDGISREAGLRMLDIRIALAYELETNLPRYFQRLLHTRHKQIYPNRIGNWFVEKLFPYGQHYREWLHKCASDMAETTNEERLVQMEEEVRNQAAKLDDIHKAVMRIVNKM